MRKVTFRDRLRYLFDRTLSRGTVALIGWLAVLSLGMIVVVGIFVTATGIAPENPTNREHPSLLQVVWMNLMRTLDAGTMGADQGNWMFLMTMLVVTLGGIFIVSTLIGVLSTGLEGRIEELRKGRSLVVEKDHVVILGWSEQVIPIVSELCIANQSRRKPRIVILADRDKVLMEDDIRDNIANPGRTRIVCRTGSAIDAGDLAIVNLDQSRAIIVLSPEGVTSPDSHVIKTILALRNLPGRRTELYHIVAEIRERRNAEAAHLVGGDEVSIVLADDLISRVAVQTCRQPGLSAVVQELLDFDGSEIYFKTETALEGKTFGEALFAYADSSIIGLQTRDGALVLNPPTETVIEVGDKVIGIAEDDSTFRLSPDVQIEINEGAMRNAAARERLPERTVMLGWNREAPFILRELSVYLPPKSHITVVTDDDRAPASTQALKLDNAKLELRTEDPTDGHVLEGLDLASYNHVVTLSSRDRMDTQSADARTLIALLHVRSLLAKAGKNVSIVSEMLDVRNRELASVTGADDFIVSNRLVALMLAQVTENKHVSALFDEIFSHEGQEIYLEPASDYIALDTPVSFYTVVEAALRRGHLAVGYLKKEGDNRLKVNPHKREKVSFAANDQLIVVGEG